MIFPYAYLIFGLRPQNHLSGPDAYALLEGVEELCGLYIWRINTLMQ